MHLSPKQPDFWGRVPAEYLRPLVIDSEKVGTPLSFFAAGDPENPETPGFAVFSMKPGEVLPRHSHDCHRFEVIIAGSMTAVGPGEGDRYLEVGDVMTAEPNQMYGPHVAGPEGFTVVEYFSCLRAAYEVTFETDRGPRQLDLLAKSRARADRRPAAVFTNEGA
ncbi:MAG: cupin domain-containing protein [Acidimicrobiales bacterium]